MSRFDYADPGTDQAYCDAISDPPHVDGDPDCNCDECFEARREETNDEAES